VSDAAPRGNVLFITVDQWRGDCLSAAGHPVVQTPNLDRLAARGVRFARHWANIAPCGPSRATLHTGMYAQNHRSVLNGTPLDDRFTNTARVARQVGYEPALFGYTDTSLDPRTLAVDDPRLSTYEEVLPGFDAVLFNPESAGSPGWARWLASKGVDVPANPAELYLPIEGYPGADAHGASWAPTRFAAEHSETVMLVETFREWLVAGAGDSPWFAHLSFIRPHPPYRNPEGYHDRYDPDDGPDFRGCASRDDEMALHPLMFATINIPGVGCPPDERDRRQQRATYWGAMKEVDDRLGELFDWLEAEGLLDDTLVVLTSDHGEQAGDHWLVEKLGWFDESYHVPMIMVDPRPEADATRGQVVDAVTEHVDVLPTLCEWMGVEVPLQCDGRPLQPFLHGGDADAPRPWRSAAHWEWDFRDPVNHLAEDLFGLTMEQCGLGVLRTDEWKLVHFGAPPEVFPPLLFSLRDDPDQVVNLAADPGHSAVLAELYEQMLRWRFDHLDRTLTGHSLSPDGLVVRRDPRV
jgi:arylsulfatase A-like enzyme